MANEKAVAKIPLVEEVALEKIQQYQSAGLVLPANYNPTNSLKKARFILNDMKVNGKPVLEVCTAESIIQCLIDSVTDGLDYSENQVYFIPRGNQMTNLESVYGRIVRAKRASKYYKPIVGYVHEGDVFEFGPDIETGLTKIIKHETALENLDKPIIAAYAYVTDDNGVTDVCIMTKREWLTSWKKSPNGASVAKEFEKDMIFRTIIKKSTKSLVKGNEKKFTGVMNEDDSDWANQTAETKAPAEPHFEEADYTEVPVGEPDVLMQTTTGKDDFDF